MPWKPRHPCRFPGCGELTDAGKTYCEAHSTQLRKEHDVRRGSANARGYTYRWSKFRRMFLNRNPLCTHCLSDGKYVAADVVDHIIPHKGDMSHFYDVSNLQSLCKSCHDRKTASEDGGLGNYGGGK